MRKIAGHTDAHHNNGIVLVAVIVYLKKCCAMVKTTVCLVLMRLIAAGLYAAYSLVLRRVGRRPMEAYATARKVTKSARKTDERA